MKLLQQITISFFLFVAAVYGVTQVNLRYNTDRTPPVISFDSDIVTVSANSSPNALLQGVTATDQKDGDLSGKVLVQGTTQLLTKDTAKVTYVVFDSSNNIATASRTVRYSDYEKPRFHQRTPLVFPHNQSVDIAALLTATDLKDGDISDNIRISTSTLDIYTTGVYTVTAQVLNSLGDSEILPLKVVISDSAKVIPSFQLSEYVVYLNVGDRFNPQQYILNVTNGNSVQIQDSVVQTDTPGIYHVAYSHTANSDNRTPNVYTVYQTVVVR